MAGRLVIATHNEGKLAEFQRLLAPLGWQVVPAGALGLAAADETGGSFGENARLKAKAAADAAGLPALADDSGLCVAALDGDPGLFSARFAGGDYPAAFGRIIQAAQTRRDWRAKFVCALSWAQPDGRIATYLGEVEGRVVAPRGSAGFGYDPIFVPDGHDRTFAELAAEKEEISHRARAFAQLRLVL